MQAVSEQMFFSNLSFEFGKRFHEHLITTFRQLATQRLEVITSRQQGLPTLPNHNAVHSDLMQYCELMKWMRECQSERFSEVCKVSPPSL